MGIATAALAGHKVTDARVSIPAWGIGYRDVTIDGEVTLTGAVDLVIADLTLKGTILSGGSAKGRSFFRVIAGFAGWGKTLPRKSYNNDAGVKLATVLGDAARECGEALDASTVSTSTRLGPAFVRPEGPACRVLEILAPNAWYVGEDSKTRLGQRPKTTLDAAVTRTSQVDKARGVVELAAESIAGILPGIAVDGLEAVDVEHTISSKGGLRSKVWGRQSSGNSRRLAAYRAIFDQLDPNRKFRGVTEYRVVTQEGERMNLQPVRVSTGMPDLRRVFVRPGVAGVKATVLPGCRVLVGFADSDPARPYVAAFEDAEGEGFVPLQLVLSGGVLGAARRTDAVQAGPFSGVITGGSVKVRIG